MDSDLKIISPLDECERGFFDKALLTAPYFQALRDHELDTQNGPFINHHRSYSRLLDTLQHIHEHDATHARSFTKRLRQGDIRNCDAVYAEAIVYSHYIPAIAEGLVRSLSLKKDDFDLCIERCDGTHMFLEVFCIMPSLTPNEDGICNVQSHIQESTSSIRQKLLRKISEQGQLSKPRENWAVIELNCHTIAGDFALLSSLSDGYKVVLDCNTMKPVTEGYDWSISVFDNVATRHLRGIMWFDLGHFYNRRILLNPRFGVTPPPVS